MQRAGHAIVTALMSVVLPTQNENSRDDALAMAFKIILAGLALSEIKCNLINIFEEHVSISMIPYFF